MIVYFSLIIPLILCIVLFLKFRDKIKWWGFLLPGLVSGLFIFGAKALTEHYRVTSEEYWGSLVKYVEYYEDWDEWITETCTRSCCCDSKGQNCGTETYDCSHSEYHPPIWVITTTLGEQIRITQEEYWKLQEKFGNNNFENLNRDFYTKNGNKYYSAWNGKPETSVAVTSIHTYENRVKASEHSSFHFESVWNSEIKLYDLKEYPEIQSGYSQPCILGDSSPDAKQAESKFAFINGSLGPKKQVKVFVLVFQNQPVSAAYYQERYWQGGNKNEFIICVGIEKERKVKWSKVISWTKSENLKTQVKDFIQSQDVLNLSSIADYIYSRIEKDFVRRQFKEFSYLTVEPSLGVLISVFVLTIGVNVGLFYFLKNYE